MRIAIVDACSSGALLAETLHARHVDLVHISSATRLPDFYARSYRRDLFRTELPFTSRLDELVQQLAAIGVDAVLAGTETGVPLADSLAAALGVPHNDPCTARARWDKDAMAAALDESDLAAPRGTRVVCVDDAVEWWRSVRSDRVVVKPVASAGTDGVRICHHEAEVRDAVAGILSRESNLLGRSDDAAIVQEFLDGPEYYINTVSIAGVHHIVEIWRYHKAMRDGAPVYDYDVPLDPTSQTGGLLSTYCRRALDALGILTGPAHLEIIVTARGPVLVDMGARLGGCAVLPARYALRSQTQLLADHLLTSASIHTADHGIWTHQGATVRRVALTNEIEGNVSTMDWVRTLESLETADCVVPRVSVGDHLARTTDLATSPGYLYLIGTAERVTRDYHWIREWELSGPYGRLVNDT